VSKVSLKGNVSRGAFASGSGVVPASGVDVEVDVAVLVVVEVGGASAMGAGGASATSGASALGFGGASATSGASAFGFGGASAFGGDAPSVVDIDVAAPSRVLMAIAVWEEHASKHNASPVPKADDKRPILRFAFKATTLSFNTSAVARLRLESSSAVAPDSVTRGN